MAYYDNVYLKRVNKYGTTIQERIQNKKNHDFLAAVAKSPNKVKILKDNENFLGILQNKVNSEKENISYLLTLKGLKWADGTVVVTENQSDYEQNRWLIFHLEEYSSIGYDKYQVIKLDRDLVWIKDEKFYSGEGYIVGSGNKSILSKFSIQFDVSGLYEPNKTLNLIMKTDGNITKGTRFIFDKEAYKVSGIDKISVPGVSYITLEEDLYDEETDAVDRDWFDLQNWYITSPHGPEQFILNLSEYVQPHFTFYYKDIVQNEEYEYEVIIELPAHEHYITIDPEKGIYAEEYFPEQILKVWLKNNPKICKEFRLRAYYEFEESDYWQWGGIEKMQLNEEGYVYLQMGSTTSDWSMWTSDHATIEELSNGSGVKVIPLKSGIFNIKIFDRYGLFTSHSIIIEDNENSFWR